MICAALWTVIIVVLVCALILALAPDDKPLPKPQPDSRNAVYNDWTVGRSGK